MPDLAHIESMTHASIHNPSPDRRALPDRRGISDRRTEDQPDLTLVPVERRTGKDRRRSDRRTSPNRSHETAREHIGNALQLLATVSQSARLDDALQRDLDSAIFRLRFALDRLEHGRP